jgi:transposase
MRRTRVKIGRERILFFVRERTKRIIDVVAIDPHSLPDNADLLRQMVVELSTQLEANERRLERIQHILEQLLKWRYGQKREKVPENQLFLFAVGLEATGQDVQDFITELEQDQDQAEKDGDEGSEPPAAASSGEKPPKRRGHGRKPLSRSLRRERIEYELSEGERSCPHCSATMHRIGEEVSERLEYVPASLKVIEQVRTKYGCSCGGSVKTAPKPAQSIEKSTAGASVLAQVAVAKYADHCPLHRQEVIFRRHGVELSRKTMCGWMRQTAEVLEPLYERLRRAVLGSKVVGTDDTPVAVLDRALPRTRTGRIWTYVGDGEHPATVYDYTATRKREGPGEFLKQFQGYLQADAYAGYDHLYTKPGCGIVEVGCWAHARRRMYEARGSDLARATVGLSYIGLLYKLERKARGMSSDERQALRQRVAVPTLEALHGWLQREHRNVLPKSPLGTAISYIRSNWEALRRYCEDGDLAIDNNASERSLRGIAIGRRNWTFFGSDRGGMTAAILTSFVASCQRHKIDPFAYLTDVLQRIANHTVPRLDELLPGNWVPASA